MPAKAGSMASQRLDARRPKSPLGDNVRVSASLFGGSLSSHSATDLVCREGVLIVDP
jgi:hypothetical protein